MIASRRWFLKTTVLGGSAWLLAKTCFADPSGIEKIDAALAKAVRFLIKQQSDDGSWRSEHYGPFKEGGALTPLVLQTLLAAPPSKETEASCRKGADYLAARVKADGSIDPGPQGLSYPLYTSAGAVVVLSHASNARHQKARDAWRAFFCQRQLTEDLGWQPEDKPYGGWGYCATLPRKPQKTGEPLAPLTESNLSATVFALDALKAVGRKADDPAIRKALVFVKRCQNYRDDPKQREEDFDDGGFFFMYDDPVRNKAGVAGKDRAGQERYYSYGSMTADGWRALLLCGQSANDPRVKAAHAWMETNFRGHMHPGKYAKDREINRDAVYYYYCCSLTQTLLTTDLKKPSWAEVLAKVLGSKQREDGSWANALVPQREDDPMVATCLAAQALAGCRRVLGAK